MPWPGNVCANTPHIDLISPLKVTWSSRMNLSVLDRWVCLMMCSMPVPVYFMHTVHGTGPNLQHMQFSVSPSWLNLLPYVFISSLSYITSRSHSTEWLDFSRTDWDQRKFSCTTRLMLNSIVLFMCVELVFVSPLWAIEPENCLINKSLTRITLANLWLICSHVASVQAGQSYYYTARWPNHVFVKTCHRLLAWLGLIFTTWLSKSPAQSATPQKIT